MNTYILLFSLSLVFSLALTPVVRRVCERNGWLDVPRDQRRVHRKATPRLGGVAVVISILAALGTLQFVDNQITWGIWAERSKMFVALAPGILVFLVGIYDDLNGISPRVKFAAQGLAASLFFALGGRIEILSVSFAGAVKLPVAVSFVVTVVWIVAVTNAFNLIDGIDGLAAGAALFAAFVMVTVSAVTGHSFVTVIALAMAGALIGFLRYNFNPASIFLGDSGSLYVGFTLATLSVQGTQKASTAVAVAIPLLAFGLPIIDTSLALFRRFTSGRPLFQGDKEHIHHKLLALGWSQRRVVLVLYGACALLGLQALLFIQEWNGSQLTGLWLFVVGVAIIVAVDRLHYHEMDEIRDGLKRNFSLTERRLRLANNIRVRRASQALSNATTLNQMFDAVKEMLELSSFAYATVQLNHVGAAAARGKDKEPVQPEIKSHNGCLYWSWENGDLATAEILKSSRLWSLSLSLSTKDTQWGYINLYRGIDSNSLLLDINHLCSFFQHQMAQAVERIVEGVEVRDAKQIVEEPAQEAGKQINTAVSAGTLLKAPDFGLS